MLNERCTLAVMKAAWRSTDGYRIRMDDEAVILSMDGIFAYVPRSRLPRKVLALIVEHIGKIPEAFEAYCASKKNGAQCILAEMMEKALNERKALAEKSEERINKTRLQYGAWEIWQGLDSGRVFAFDPDNLQMIDENAQAESLVADDMALMIADGAWVMIEQRELDPTVRKNLEMFQWTGGVSAE